MIQPPIIVVDVHGCTVEQAMNQIQKALVASNCFTYRIRVIHGYHGGTRIRDAIRQDFGYELEPKIKRIVPGDNEGITELVLREY